MPASNTVRTRGLTLIEVLLAVVLLAALAGASVGIFRDAARAAQRHNPTSEFDAATRLVSTLTDEQGEALGKLAVGASWRPPIDSEATEIIVTREPCEGCPEGWARLRVTAGEVVLTRFRRVDPRPESTE
jgi:prepilin-type N-terminal cleavage/methylation domain-containing protein